MQNFWNEFTDIFNNREISLIFWLVFVFLLATFKEGISFLKSTLGLLKQLFSKSILITQFTFWAYLTGVVFLLEFLGLWNMGMIKDTFIFLLITALVLVMKIATEKNRKQSLKAIFADAVKPVIFAEFIMNLESFSLFWELLLLPIMLVFYFGAYTYKDKPGEENTAKGFNVILTLITLFILGYGIHYLYSHWHKLDKQQTIRDFLFPVLTTLAFIPYLYFTILYFKWEEKKVQEKIRNMYK